jgi:hypothetical protein
MKMWTPDAAMANRLDDLIANNPREVREARKYAGEDEGFLRWLLVANAYASRKGIGLFDLADCPFRDWYDDGIEPLAAFRLALANEGF